MPKQCGTHLSAEDRETLSLGLTQGHSLWTLARVFLLAPNTVSREHTRNSVRRLYQARTTYALAAATGLGKPAVAKAPRFSRLWIAMGCYSP